MPETTWPYTEVGHTQEAKRGRRADEAGVVVVWRDVTNLDPATERAFIESTVAGEPAGERLINADAAIPGFQSLDLTFKELLEREDT